MERSKARWKRWHNMGPSLEAAVAPPEPQYFVNRHVEFPLSVVGLIRPADPAVRHACAS